MIDILTTEQIACIKELWPELSETGPWDELLASHEALRADQRWWKATAEELDDAKKEAEAAVWALAEAIRGYNRGCIDNHRGGACGGDWPCYQVNNPMNRALALPVVARILSRVTALPKRVEWQTPAGDTFTIQGDWLSHENCGFTWHKQHAALDSMEEWCPVCRKEETS